MLVDPPKDLENAYETLLSVETTIIEALKPGKKLSEVYASGIEAIKDKPIAENLLKNNFG